MRNEFIENRYANMSYSRTKRKIAQNRFQFISFSIIFFILLGCYDRQMSRTDGWSYNSGKKVKNKFSGGSIGGARYDLSSDIQLRTEDNGRANDEEVVQSSTQGAIDGLAERKVDEIAALYERYNAFTENEWIKAVQEAKSTFSIDVDNASYTNFRRFVNNGQLPPKDAIRVEEWLNFFNYDLAAPTESDVHPIKITSEIGECPWNKEDDLLMIKLQGKLPPPPADLPASNLVFLLDVSGSMSRENKLPLVQESMITLTNQLRAQDKVSIVTYAGASEIVLLPTSGAEKEKIIDAINGLTSGGGTAGAKGVETAYELAEQNFNSNGNNRIIIASDGDWNIGTSDDKSLVKMIEEKRETGIFLSVLGFGMYNLNDAMMEQLADNGNGNYAYIDSKKEADRLFKSEFAGAIHVIAKDVKLQVAFDSTVVQEYRLLGYENRVLENWEFEADSIDAGDLGMGQNVIAFYQIKRKKGANKGIGKLDFRYKPLNSDVSTLVSHAFGERTEVSSDFKFASCVVEYALALRESEYRNNANMATAIFRGKQNLGDESKKLSYEKRVEFVGLMEKSAEMWTGYVVEKAPDKKIDNAPKLKLYPNPATDFITIEIPKELSGYWSVQIFAASGKLELVQHFEETSQGRIEVNSLVAGTYIVKVYGNGYNYGYLRLVKT